MPAPVRIRLYGLISVTKRGYLTQLVLASMLLVVLLVVRSSLPPLPIGYRPQDLGAGGAVALWLLSNLHWVVLGLLLLFMLEAFFVLRSFAREEARQKNAFGSPSMPA
jgi:uncharacterized membrane protein